ncbi:MAG: M1 family metallopeptidase [Thermomicrobiales bacterium]
MFDRKLPIHRVLAALATLALALATSGALSAENWRPDPLTPSLGHPGYDTLHTTIALELDIPAGAIDRGVATITAAATEPLANIVFDLRDGVTVDRVLVNAAPTEFTHQNDDLNVSLPAPANAGDTLTVEVDYHGIPGDIADYYQRGWWADGQTIFIIGEPGGAEAWFPVNNEPLDAAVWTLDLTVPAGVTVVAGGAPGPVTTDNGKTTTRWLYEDPVAPYLLAFAAGNFDVLHPANPAGVALTFAVPPGLDPDKLAVFDATPEMIDYFTTLFGPFPGKRFGAAVVDDFGGALETEEMVIFGAPSVTYETLAHELAHQWFGNSVRLESWSDIWLNEAFGRYAEILWTEHEEGPIARDAALQALASTVRRHHASATPPIGRPTADSMFGGDTYNLGALALHALRGELGDVAFFRLLHEWNSRYANQAVGTAEFIALTSEIAGHDMTGFFDEWLYAPVLPDPLLVPAG